MNNENILIHPTVDYLQEIKDYRNEMIENGDSFDGCSDLRKFEDINKWIQYTYDLNDKDKIPAHYVTAEQYILVRKNTNRVLGMIQLRHELNDYLYEFGGHIGYSIRPNERNKGYANEMLSRVLNICKDKGMDKVLLTCNDDNIASRKTILKNHGVFENKSYEIDEDNYIERYWIYLNQGK